MIIAYHMTVDLAWALRCSTQYLRGMLRDETGHTLSGWAVRRRLREAQAQGYTVLPVCETVNAHGYCLGHRDTDTPERQA
jgi:hypothetical protein